MRLTVRILKHSIHLFTLTLILSCTSTDKKPGFKINARIKHLENTMIYLAKLDMNTNKRIIVDSVGSTDGHFVFEGNLDYPYLHALFLGDDSYRIDFFLENVNLDIDGDFNKLRQIQISGSREDSLFRPWFNNKPFEDKQADLDIILNNPEFHLSPFIAFYHFQTFETSIDSIEMIISSFDKSLFNSPYYRSLIQLYETLSTVKIGEDAPEFTLPDTIGRTYALSDFRGRYVFLDFWAEWCSPCRKANKELIKIYPTLNTDSIEFISISLDETRVAWKRAIKEDQLNWLQLSDLKAWESDIGKTYGIRAIPQNFLIDQFGKIIGKNIQYKELNRFKVLN